MGHARLVALAVTLVLALAPRPSRADDAFLKSSPGELSASHAALDRQDKCETCHEPDRSVSAAKCLGCHEHSDLKKRIDAGHGFHVSAKVKGRECRLCHKEHRGRGFDPMGWQSIGGPQRFDHAWTSWPLEGKHQVIDCGTCHTSSNAQGLRTYMSASRTCGACHAKDSPHGQLRPLHQACDRCHSNTVWRPQKPRLEFDHDDKSQAAMPLDGSHADVACTKCHPKAQFKLPSFSDGACAQCHKSPHDGQLFSTKKCQQCHAASFGTMREVRFDHRRDAGYALTGKHAALPCGQCHTRALGMNKPQPECERCHAADNRHGNRFARFGSPPVCATCHSQSAWTSGFQFNHAASTGFALTAKHARLGCRSCHRGGSPAQFERHDIGKGCMSCHQHKAAHGGKFANDQCLTCHQEGGSKKQKKAALETYHGEQSRFPLRGGHAGVPCQACHANDVYEATPTECGGACHEDSLHRGSLGAQCSRCHQPGVWSATGFDHTADTTWPLEGKHAAIAACDRCHPARRYDQTPTRCGAAGCHQADDVHGGKLGDGCERCHREDGALLFRHNRDAQFQVDGAHTRLVCASCHPSAAFKPVRRDCVGCHSEPAVHKGRFGTRCESCHSTRTFADVRALHDVGDFSLTGAHDELDCARCHPRGEKLRGSGNLCITCHRKDDIHNNALSPRCGECHTQRAFAPARFDHLTVGCALTGLHATLPCGDCHRGGNYGAVTPLCVGCHRDDALRVRTPDHRSLFECGNCHNPSAWLPANQLGVQTICR